MKKWVIKYGIINNEDSLTSRDQGILKRTTKEGVEQALREEVAFLKKVGISCGIVSQQRRWKSDGLPQD